MVKGHLAGCGLYGYIQLWLHIVLLNFLRVASTYILGVSSIFVIFCILQLSNVHYTCQHIPCHVTPVNRTHVYIIVYYTTKNKHIPMLLLLLTVPMQGQLQPPPKNW